MSLLVVVGLGAIAWAVLCALIVAVCASAKEGDGQLGTMDPSHPRRDRRSRSAIPTPR